MSAPKKSLSELNISSSSEKVEVFIPRGQANDDPNLFVSVNGVNYLLPKGKASKVPKAVAREIKRAFAAEETLFSRSEKLQNTQN